MLLHIVIHNGKLGLRSSFKKNLLEK